MTDTTTAPTDTTTQDDATAEDLGTQASDPTPTKDDKPKPLFTDFGVDQDLADELRSRGIVHPFPIQELSLPLGLKGHDLIGQARTGTGKTLGFGLPLIQRIDTSKAQTQALVIVPTRELCIQVADDLTVGAGRGVTSIAVYGGVGYDEQIEALTTGVHIVVGTPGRTLDHLGRGNLDVSGVHTVVLDEADEMLDMGFLPDVERLLVDVPESRQTLLFSATMPTAIVKLARRFMDKPTFMRADETLHETAPTVEQHFFLVHRMDKPRVLARLLQMPDRGGAFVFCRTKRMCDRLVQELDGLGINAIAVHGDLRQSSRERNLDKFRAGTSDVLVATEVAARGLDVSNVTHVVNYDCPDDEKMYLHRIGRTARAGESGVAVTFAEFNEVDRVNVIRKRVESDSELTEVFSTSDTLTELFDLPETTPWDDLGSSRGGSSSGSSSKGSSSKGGSSKGGSSKGGSSRGGSSRGSSDGRGSRGSSKGSSRGGSSGSGSSNGGSSRDRSSTGGSSGRSSDRGGSRRASSSGSNRSSGRTDQHAEGADTSSSTPRNSSRRDDDSSSRTRTRTRRRGGDAASRGSREADTTTGKADADRTSTDSSTRTTSDRRDSSTRDDSNRDDSTRNGSTRDDGESTRATGGARPRARRNRRRGGSSSSGSSSSSSSRGDRSGRDDSTSSSDRGRSDDRGNSRSGGNGSTTSGSRNRSGGRSSGRDESRSREDRSGESSGRRRVTSRGDDARGGGTPRLDRRVDVEHLP